MPPKRRGKRAGWTGWQEIDSDDEDRVQRERQERQAANGFGLPDPDAIAAAGKLTQTRRRAPVQSYAEPDDDDDDDDEMEIDDDSASDDDNEMDVDQESASNDDDEMDVDDQQSIGSEIVVSQPNVAATPVSLNSTPVSASSQNGSSSGTSDGSLVSDVPTLDDAVNERHEVSGAQCNDPIVEKLPVTSHDKIMHTCSDPKHEGALTVTCDQCFEIYEEDRTVLTERECLLRDEGAFMPLCEQHAAEIRAADAVILCTCRTRHSRQTICTTCSIRHTKRLARAYRKEKRRHDEGKCHQCLAQESGLQTDGICAYCGGSKTK